MSTLNPAADLSSHAHDDHGHHEIGFVKKYIFSTDHKMIGIQFLFTTLFMLLVGGSLALGVRFQLAWPWRAMPLVSQVAELTGGPNFIAEGGQISPEFYTMLFTMHASVMIFLVIIPILAGAFGNFLIPLMIGADDMAFPVLNMLSYWFMWPAIVCFGLSFLVGGLNAAPAQGWTSYPVLSAIRDSAPGAGDAQTWWLFGLTLVGVSSMMGSVNYMTTIINMRAPGMTLFRMPLTIWSMFITAILQAFALPVLTAAGFMLVAERMLNFNFFVPGGLIVNNGDPTVGGGQPLLWQHLFWFYSHPAVYIMLLPAMGMVSDMLACVVRKPIFGYKPMVYSMAAIAGLGFIVWGHHMFTSGMNPALGMTFMISTMMIALDWHDLGRKGRVQHGHAQLCRIRINVRGRRIERHIHGRSSCRYLLPRHLLHCCPFPLRPVWRDPVRMLRSNSVLVPKNVGTHDERTTRKGPLYSDVHWFQRDVLPNASSWDCWIPTPICGSIHSPIHGASHAHESVHYNLRCADGFCTVSVDWKFHQQHLYW